MNVLTIGIDVNIFSMNSFIITKMKNMWSDRGVELVRVIKRKLGWSSYKMAKTLGIPAIQFSYTEKTARSVRIDLLIRIIDLAMNTANMSLEECFKLLGKDAEIISKEKRKEIKR